MTESTQIDPIAVHYVVRRGILDLGRDPEHPGQRICYRAGDVLPPKIGAAEAREHPHAVEIRPGHAEPLDPFNPMATGGGPGAPVVQESTLTAADEARIAAVVRVEMEDARSRADRRDAGVGDAVRERASALVEAERQTKERKRAEKRSIE